MPEKLLICAANGEGPLSVVHACRSERLRGEGRVVTGHVSSQNAICGKSVRIWHPFQPADPVLLLDETKSCPECLDMLLQMKIDAGCAKEVRRAENAKRIQDGYGPSPNN